MENLRAIRDRITTIGSIIQATNAMKMVSTIKLARINNINKFSKDCSGNLFNMLSILLNNIIFEQTLKNGHWLLPNRLDKNKTLILVFSTDQGFCGSFNQFVIDEAKKVIKSSGDNNEEVIIKIFGKKAAILSPKDLTTVENKVDIKLYAQTAADIVIDHLKNYGVGKVVVVSSMFKNVLVQRASSSQIFPFDIDPNAPYAKIDGNPTELVESLFFSYIKKTFNAIITEHIIAELSARVMAMDNSVRNAKDMHVDLNTLYNRSRQAKITQELNEIVSSIECSY